jgi:predicted TPR repeat methyltransferase
VIAIPLRNILRSYWHYFVDTVELLICSRDRLDAVCHEKIAAGFDQWSHLYDEKMSYFNYTGPRLLSEATQEFLEKTPRRHKILDMGCGTGLCGIQFKPLAEQLDGVDISRGMLERARKSCLYDHLEKMDLISYLSKSLPIYDLVISAGVLQFFSGLEALFSGVNSVLRNEGYFAFTVDKLDGSDRKYKVSPRHGTMYVHNPDYIHEVAILTNFVTVKSGDMSERHDMLENKPVPGLLYVLQKKH